MENTKKNFVDQLKGFFHKNKFEKELKETLAAVVANPQDLRVKIRLGEVYFRMKDIPKGIEVFTEVVEAYTQEGFYLKALAIYKNMIRMSPGSVQFNEKLAELYKQLGLMKDAVNQYLIVIHYYQNHGEKEKVLEAAQKMVEIDPQDVPNRMRLAEIYFNHGLQNEALKEYEQIGNQLKEEGGKQLGLLIEVLEKVSFRRPQDKDLLREICILYLKNHDPESAIRKIEKYKLEKEGDFEKIHEKAREIMEHDHKREEEKKMAEMSVEKPEEKKE